MGKMEELVAAMAEQQKALVEQNIAQQGQIADLIAVEQQKLGLNRVHEPSLAMYLVFL